MILGIDASNIRGGGGVTHLKELLEHADPKKFGFDSVYLWSGKKTLDQISDRSWLRKIDVPDLSQSLFHRIYWQKFKLSQEALKHNCDLLFIPGGSYSGNFKNIVSMSQNLLPFDWKELFRYGISLDTLKFLLLRFTQSRTFARSLGVIFLTNAARAKVLESVKLKSVKTLVVNHGIHKRFFLPTKRVHRDVSEINFDFPLKLLYVSFIGEYKHQWRIVHAVSKLLEEGIAIQLTLVGNLVDKKASKRLKLALQENKKWAKYFHHKTDVSYEEVDKLYKSSDVFLFASTCETFGQIVTEAMASGLPIIASNIEVMKEILGTSALYFDPENEISIKETILKIYKSKVEREKYSIELQNQAKTYSWEKCADESFHFFKEIIEQMQN